MEETEVRSCYPRAMRYALSLTGNQDDAHDLVQSSLVKCLDAEKSAPIAELMPFLRKTIFHQWVSAGRRAARITFVSAESLAETHACEMPAALGARHPAVENFAFWHVLSSRILKLPDDQRQAILLLGVEGYDYQEVSAALGEPTGTLKSRLHRARKRLAEWSRQDDAV